MSKRTRADYGGVDDGTCEYSFLERCDEPAVESVTFGQFNGWTYKYCIKHANLMREVYKK